MTTTGEQLVTLSGLSSNTALTHLLAIEVGSGTGTTVNDGIGVELAETSYLVELATMDVDVVVNLEPIEVVIEDASIDAEIVTDTIELEIQ